MITEAIQAQSLTGSFDTSSKVCVSHNATDFVGDIIPSNCWIKGFGGSKTTNVKTGTLRWSLEDTEGKNHSFLILNSSLVQQGGVQLLSPQHWAQTQGDPITRGTGSTTASTQVNLFWKGCQFTKTIPSDASNVAKLCFAPGCSQFAALMCAEADVDQELEDSQPMCFECSTNIVSNNNNPEDEGEEETVIGPRDFLASTCC
jgi:hypothetical protein